MRSEWVKALLMFGKILVDVITHLLHNFFLKPHRIRLGSATKEATGKTLGRLWLK